MNYSSATQAEKWKNSAPNAFTLMTTYWPNGYCILYPPSQQHRETQSIVIFVKIKTIKSKTIRHTDGNNSRNNEMWMTDRFRLVGKLLTALCISIVCCDSESSGIFRVLLYLAALLLNWIQLFFFYFVLVWQRKEQNGWTTVDIDTVYHTDRTHTMTLAADNQMKW